MENLVAIVTADVVHSRSMDPARLETRFREITHLLEQELFDNQHIFERYRGDSFQARLKQPAESLKIALLWRAGLRATDAEQPWDLRLSIGLGTEQYASASGVGQSAGSAYERSGALLDILKARDQMRLAISTPHAAWNEALQLQGQLAEGLIRRWTPLAAEAVFYALLYGENQEALAARLGISQPSVHKRLQTASWPAIRLWEAYFRRQVLSYIQTRDPWTTSSFPASS
jgi:hypothetical protein